MALEIQHFMYGFDFQELELMMNALLGKLLQHKMSPLFFFFFPAVVTNSVRYKIKITYFVINILIY